MEIRQFEWKADIDIGICEHLVDLIRQEFPVSVVGDGLHTVTEILAHLLRHADAVLLLHDIADAAPARLAVDADYVTIVGTSDILRVDVEIRQ